MSAEAGQPEARGVVSSWLYRYQMPGERYESWIHVRLRRQGKSHPSPRREYPQIKPCHGATA